MIQVGSRVKLHGRKGEFRVTHVRGNWECLWDCSGCQRERVFNYAEPKNDGCRSARFEAIKEVVG